jgi:DNA invertase Pin-like site-specific DNA recombinase
MTKTRGSRVSKRVAIYLRVSTTEQTTTNQRRELHAVAKRHWGRHCSADQEQIGGVSLRVPLATRLVI